MTYLFYFFDTEERIERIKADSYWQACAVFMGKHKERAWRVRLCESM
jgi:hypothetical protein